MDEDPGHTLHSAGSALWLGSAAETTPTSSTAFAVSAAVLWVWIHNQTLLANVDARPQPTPGGGSVALMYRLGPGSALPQTLTRKRRNVTLRDCSNCLLCGKGGQSRVNSARFRVRMGGGSSSTVGNSHAWTFGISQTPAFPQQCDLEPLSPAPLDQAPPTFTTPQVYAPFIINLRL